MGADVVDDRAALDHPGPADNRGHTIATLPVSVLLTDSLLEHVADVSGGDRDLIECTVPPQRRKTD